VTALPDISGVPHPAAWPFYPHRWLGRLVIRHRFAVAEHGTHHVPAQGPVVLAANHAGVADGPLLWLFGPRHVHVLPGSRAARAHLRVLADGHALGVLPQAPGEGEASHSHRGAAYLALVSGAPVVPVTFVRGPERRLDIVYGAPYRTDRHPWPRTKKLVEITSFDLRVHLLVALDAARTLTGSIDTDPPPAPAANPGGSR
jgi:1-acyl-sn-glycerol-3-phosphate acyltransferase